LAKKSQIFFTALSFSALARGDPFRIYGKEKHYGSRN